MIASLGRLITVATTLAAVVTAPSPASAAVTSNRPAHLANEACAPRALTILAWTNFAAYSPRSSVAITAAVRNSGPVACTISLGGTSPNVTIRGPRGSVVWAPCGLTSPCPLYLAVTTLQPGASHVQTWRWNQRISARLAPRGTYRVETRVGGASSSVTTSFRLASRTTQPTVVADLSDNARRLVLARGATLVVRLAPRGLYAWSSATASARLGTRLSLGGTSVLADFVGRESGGATVRATATPTCYPQCLMPSQLYRLSVTVAP